MKQNRVTNTAILIFTILFLRKSMTVIPVTTFTIKPSKLQIRDVIKIKILTLELYS